MAYRAAPARNFSAGLNLKAQAGLLREDQALDALNVAFTTTGGVKQRAGFDNLTTSELTNQPDSLAPFYTTTSVRQLVVGNGNRLDVVNTSGASVANVAPTANPHFFARFGGPAAERIYIANGTDTVRYWDGSAFTTPAYTGTTPTGKFLAVTGWDNRLVSACHIGTTAASNPSSLIFSEPGDPHTFNAGSPNNVYVQLTPGDGEAIMGMVGWREFLFVFKETSFFVFHGTTTGANGYPEFLYRQVRAGAGLASSRALAVGRDGVYFLDRKGVYRTTGGEPEIVSEPVEPIFFGTTSDFYSGGTLAHSSITNAAMVCHEEKVYLAFPSNLTTNDRMLVYDTVLKNWTLWDIPAAALSTFRISEQDELVFARPAGLNYIDRHSTSYQNDDGAAITSRWRSGWFDYGNPDVKAIRETKLWGAGNFVFGLGKDYQAISKTTNVNLSTGLDLWDGGAGGTWGDGTDPSDLWGPSTAVLPRLVRLGIRGTLFSVQFSNSTLDRTWEIHRYENHLRESRTPNVVRTEAA